MEIRLSLDRTDPPAGRIMVLPDADARTRVLTGREFSFAGWLGLLRALYEVTGAPAGGASGVP